MQVTVTVPDRVFASAVRLARLTRRDVADVLTDALTHSLPALPHDADLPPALETLGDDAILALTEQELPPAHDRRLSVLLDRQQAGQLSDPERDELESLLQLYREGVLSKAQALAEAVRRGLRPPPAP